MTRRDGNDGVTMAPLLGRLREAAREDIDTRLVAARAEAQHLIDAARERLTSQQASTLHRRRQDLERDRERRRHEARDAATREILAAGERLIDRVMRRVLEQAGYARDWPETGAWMRHALSIALEFLPEGPFVLRTSHPGALELAQRVAPGRDAQLAAPDSTLGMMVGTPDGRLLVHATLERFLHAERPRLAQAIVRLALEDSA